MLEILCRTEGTIGSLLFRTYGVPYTAAFHVQPEDVTFSIHLGKVDWVNDCVYLWFRHYVFRYGGSSVH